MGRTIEKVCETGFGVSGAVPGGPVPLCTEVPDLNHLVGARAGEGPVCDTAPVLNPKP